MPFDNTNVYANLNTNDVAPEAAAPAPLTKEQRIAQIDEKIAKLQQRREDILNDVVPVKAAAKEVVLPEIGDKVTFVFGRKTANTSPTERVGEVVAIKPAVKNGERTSPAQVKVTFGEGFDAEFAVVYPAQIISIEKAAIV